MPQVEASGLIVELPVGVNMTEVLDKMVRASAGVILSKTADLNAAQAMTVFEKTSKMFKEAQGDIEPDSQSIEERWRIVREYIRHLGFGIHRIPSRNQKDLSESAVAP